MSVMVSSSALTAGNPHGLAGALLNWWRLRTTTAPRQLRLVETLPLGPKRSVALLELDGRRFLAGMGADGVQTLLQVGTSDTEHGSLP